METTIEKSTASNKIVLIVISSIFTFVGVVSFIFHFQPNVIAELINEASRHHFFLIGFLSLATALVSFKFYFRNPNGRKFIPENIKKIRARRIAKRIARRQKLKAYLHRFKASVKKSEKNENSRYIDKSEIPQIRFSNEEVLVNPEDRELRKNDLLKALHLGNLHKQKVKLFFLDKGNKKYTHATIWHVDENNIYLKGGAYIPVKRVFKIVF